MARMRMETSRCVGRLPAMSREISYGKALSIYIFCYHSIQFARETSVTVKINCINITSERFEEAQCETRVVTSGMRLSHEVFQPWGRDGWI